MSDTWLMSEKFRNFLEILHTEVADYETCAENASQAIAGIAEDLKIGRLTQEIDAPVSAIRPKGIHHESVLYDSKKENYGKGKTKVFSLADGGTVTVILYPAEKDSFTKEEMEIWSTVQQEVFLQFNRVMMQNLLQNVLHTDMATGVANQAAFMQFIGKLVATGEIRYYTGIFSNIHNFQYVNRIFPYSEGDIVLRNYAGLLDRLLMEDEIVARLGGDNFVLLVKNNRQETILSKLQHIRLTHRTEVKEKEFVFSATIGYSELRDIRSPREVMARISTAYQAARQRGAGSVAEYSTEIRNKLAETQAIISGFQPAMEAHDFIVYYQPKVDIRTRKICGAEALVRWLHNGELIPPAKFIPQLEREGSICRLDYYVLEETCKFIRRRLDEGKSVPCISVNFSRKHLEENHLVRKIVATIDRHDVDHRYIEIELTESEDFQNYEVMSEIVNGLKQEGIGTSIDDFGTGYSSLNMIKKVDLNVIKIDKSFIPLETDYTGKEIDKVMFTSMIDMIKKLGKKTIAEGVETKEQLQYLLDVGCDIVQGYVFDKPMPEKAFDKRLEQGYGDGK